MDEQISGSSVHRFTFSHELVKLISERMMKLK